MLVFVPRLGPDDEYMAFLYYWIEELSKYFPYLIVVSFHVSSTLGLPKNVFVINLELKGKYNRYKKVLVYLYLLFKLRNHYDKILVFMYPLVGLVSAIFSNAFMRKPTYFYYAHGSVTLTLKLATFFVRRVFTTSDSGFRIRTKKKTVLSQGINLDLFDVSKYVHIKKENIVLYVGRVSKIKRIHYLAYLPIPKDWKVVIIGPIHDGRYYSFLKSLFKKRSVNVEFLGKQPYTLLPKYYARAKVMINPSKTGSLDKTVLEAWAMKLVVLTSNEAYLPLMKDLSKKYYFENISDLIYKFAESSKEGFVLDESLYNLTKSHERRSFVKNLATYLR